MWSPAPEVGCLLYRGDVIETGVDGAVEIIFENGAVFSLSADGRMVLDEFACDAEGQLQSGLFKLIRGAFAFFTGKFTPTGDLSINTPLANIRGTALSGGMGALTFAAFTFAMLKEAQAESQGLAYLIDDTMDTNDLEHGVFQVTTSDGQVTTVGDTLESVIIRPRGSGVTIEHVINSAQDLATLLAASKEAQELHQQAQQDIDVTDLSPTSAGGGSSGGIVTPILPPADQQLPASSHTPPPPPPPPAVVITPNTTPTGFTDSLIPTSSPPPPAVDHPPTTIITTAPTDLIEAGGVANSLIGAPASSATIGISDIDGTASFDTAAFLADGWTSSAGGTTYFKNGTYGVATFTVATGVLTYALTNSSIATEALTANDTRTETFTIPVKESDGALTATQDIVFTIHGSNDNATITSSASEDTSVTEAGGGPGGTPGDAAASGQLTVHDVDGGEDHFLAVAPAALAGTYGNFSFNALTGMWSYTLDQAKADPLTAGQQVTDTLTVSSVDGTAQQTITVHITGSNDNATITASASEDTSVTEAGGVANSTPGDATASGQLTVHDVDSGENHFLAVAPAALAGTYGNFSFNALTGVWSYTLGPGQGRSAHRRPAGHRHADRQLG